MDENPVNGERGAAPEKSPRTLWMLGGIVLLALVGFALARGMGDRESDEQAMLSESGDTNLMMTEVSNEGQTAAPQEMMPSEAMMPRDAVQMIAVEGGSFYFKPSEIRVKKGEKVKIVFSSVSMVHDFVVDELDIRTSVIPAGQTATVEFTADKTGTFEYYCSVGQHRANGMVGQLIVE